MNRQSELKNILRGIGGRGCKVHLEIKSNYDLGEYSLFIGRVQGYPFALPSRARVQIPIKRANAERYQV